MKATIVGISKKSIVGRNFELSILFAKGSLKNFSNTCRKTKIQIVVKFNSYKKIDQLLDAQVKNKYHANMKEFVK